MNLLALFARWVSEGNDAKLQELAQTPVVKFTGFEQWKGIQSARKARLHSSTGRPYAKASHPHEVLRRAK